MTESEKKLTREIIALTKQAIPGQIATPPGGEATPFTLPPEEKKELETTGFTCIWTDMGGRNQAPNLEVPQEWIEAAQALDTNAGLSDEEQKELEELQAAEEAGGDYDDDRLSELQDKDDVDPDRIIACNVVISKDEETAADLANTGYVGSALNSRRLADVTIDGVPYGVFAVTIDWGYG